jgi:hypothetical protein
MQHLSHAFGQHRVLAKTEVREANSSDEYNTWLIITDHHSAESMPNRV